MGEQIYADEAQINELNDEIARACAAYVASYNDLAALMHKFQDGSGSIGGPLAQQMYSLFAQKEDTFSHIRKDLCDAQGYMGEKANGLIRTMNKISGNFR